MAGALSLDDAARVMALWSQAAETLRYRGGMASVQLSPKALEPYLERWSGHINVAAHNGPGVTVITGDIEPFNALLEELRVDGVRAQPVSVEVAGHSPHFDEVHEPHPGRPRAGRAAGGAPAVLRLGRRRPHRPDHGRRPLLAARAAGGR